MKNVERYDIMSTYGGMIDMKNGNALIALAYVKETENPLEVFCNYIVICLLESSEKKLRCDEIETKINERFGLNMPSNLLKMCCRILQQDKRIEKLANGAGYELKDTTFDYNKYNEKRISLQRMERLVINGLITYVEKYNLNWEYDDARNELSEFLISRGNAALIFSDKTVEAVEMENHVPNSWYVAKYITYMLEVNDDRTEYMLDIVNGLMIYLGLYEIGDYREDKEKKFRGTKFFLDTKLILRLLGYSWELETKSVKEMVDLIRNEYGGTICVLEHTISEVEFALRSAAMSLKKNETILDTELRVFSSLMGCTYFDFELYGKSVRRNIEGMHIHVQRELDWSKETVYRCNLDWEKVKEFIKKRHPKWKDRAIGNDVDSINYINILRKGDYSIKYGGRKRLPVFITSNTALVWDVKNYILENSKDDKGVAAWNTNALPIITDNMLICRLWLPKADAFSSLPELTLARNAYAAQQVGYEFFDRLRESARDLKQKHNIDAMDISQVMRDKLEELLIKNIAGNIEDVTAEILARSVEELVKLETADLHSTVDELHENEKKHSTETQKSKENIVKSATERYKRRAGRETLVIQAVSFWWIYVAVVFAGLGLVISYVKQTPYFNGLAYSGAAYVFVFILLKVLEKALSRNTVGDSIMAKVTERQWKHFSRKVRKSLLDFEKEMEEEILESCIKEIPVFRKYRKYCKCL